MTQSLNKTKDIIASIIIPVADDSRNDYLDKLLQALEKQTFKNFEVILVIGDKRQGRSINKGAREAQGRWLITMDDDTQIEDDALLEKLINQMEENPSIGLGGAACVIPKWATKFQKKAMREIPRRFFPCQEQIVDSDFVQHPCLIISKELFMNIGGEDEELIRGLDPVLRQKVREAGKRVCVVANTSVVHLLPDSLRAVVSMYRRNGLGSAFAVRFFPQRVLELTNGYDQGNFQLKRSLKYRIARRLFGVLENFAKANWIRQAANLAYMYGWVEGWLFANYPQTTIKVEYEQEVDSSHSYELKKFRVLKSLPNIEEQIARLHIEPTREFLLSGKDHPALQFYRDKVGIFRAYASEGFIYETDEQGEVVGYLLVMMIPTDFKRKLYSLDNLVRYFLSVVFGRYSGTEDGWKKWIRIPLAYLKKQEQSSHTGGARIFAVLTREDQRQKGILRKMMRRAENIALALDRHHLHVIVLKTNERMLNICQRYGFEIIGETLESTGSCWVLEKSIGVP